MAPPPAIDATLRTPRLELVPLSPDDVEALWPFVSDPELPRMMTWEAHPDREVTRAFLARTRSAQLENTSYVWTLRLEGQVCGMIGLHELVRVIGAWRQDRAELGYWIGAAYRDRGLITEAAREVLRFGFQELDLHKINVGCAVENLASRRVIEKLGFRLVGTQRDHFFRFERWWDHLAYEMVVGEWSALG
jgi:ribosomal-protein-alanine N-acetyltransferase